jgi:hypothetical protein
MTAVTASTFRVADPGGRSLSARSMMLFTGVCLFLTLVSYIVIATLSLAPLEIAGETMWVRP